MSEIKFRYKLCGWKKSKRKNKWHYDTVAGAYETPRGIEIDYETLARYTGLQDRTGKEIYAGDIITVPKDDCRYEGIVRYQDGGFVIWGMPNCYLGELMQYFKPRVIANICENPEIAEKSRY